MELPVNSEDPSIVSTAAAPSNPPADVSRGAATTESVTEGSGPSDEIPKNTLPDEKDAASGSASASENQVSAPDTTDADASKKLVTLDKETETPVVHEVEAKNITAELQNDPTGPKETPPAATTETNANDVVKETEVAKEPVAAAEEIKDPITKEVEEASVAREVAANADSEAPVTNEKDGATAVTKETETESKESESGQTSETVGKVDQETGENEAKASPGSKSDEVNDAKGGAEKAEDESKPCISKKSVPVFSAAKMSAMSSSSSSSSSIMAEFNKIAKQAPGRSISFRTALSSSPSASSGSNVTFRPVVNASKRPTSQDQSQNQNQGSSPDSLESTSMLQSLEAPEILTAAASVVGDANKRGGAAEGNKENSNSGKEASPPEGDKSSDANDNSFRMRQNDAAAINRFTRPYAQYLSSRRFYDYYTRGRLANQATTEISKSSYSISELEQSDQNDQNDQNDQTDPTCLPTNETESSFDNNVEQDDSEKQNLPSEPSSDESAGGKRIELTKRYHIVAELVSVEKDYVESLNVIINKYLPALKSSDFWDSNVAVTKMFSGIAQITGHHSALLAELEALWANYNENVTVGDMFISTFSKPAVVETYCNFIEHFDNGARYLDVSLLSKPAFVKFEDEFRKSIGIKLPLMALLIKPAQRIPRYELLLKRLADHTDQSHADSQLLQEAIEVVHKAALSINDVQVAQDKRIVTLKHLEDVLGIDLANDDRTYLRHDVVQLQSTQLEKTPDCHVFLFSDFLVLATLKKKAAVSQKHSQNMMLYFASGGHEFLEPGTRFKVINQPQLTDVNILPENASVSKRQTMSNNAIMVQLQSDRTSVEQMIETAARLSVPHQQVDDALKELLTTLNAKISRLKTELSRDRKTFQVTGSKITLCIGSDQKLFDLVFQNDDRKMVWDNAFTEAKSHLNKMTDL